MFLQCKRCQDRIPVGCDTNIHMLPYSRGADKSLEDITHPGAFLVMGISWLDWFTSNSEKSLAQVFQQVFGVYPNFSRTCS